VKDMNFARVGDEVTFAFRCKACGAPHTRTVKIAAFGTKELYCECGKTVVLDCYDDVINSTKVVELIQKYKTAFYGIGHIFKKLFCKCDLWQLDPDQYYMLESAPSRINKKGTTNYFSEESGDNFIDRTRILAPEAIDRLGIEKVIVTIGGTYDVKSLVAELEKNHPSTEFVLWQDL
jgi:hypothetical protein